jgi:hypothetical protein
LCKVIKLDHDFEKIHLRNKFGLSVLEGGDAEKQSAAFHCFGLNAKVHMSIVD